jgi:nitroreductase
MKTHIADRALDLTDEVRTHRKADHDMLPLFLNRWSPRSMTGEPLPQEDVLCLFEAARWAPSSYNGQPWRFILARRQNADQWKAFTGLLVPQNGWAEKAAILAVVVSRKTFEKDGKPSVTHAFDAGSAWENLALEAARRGLVAHAMEGFDFDRARGELGVPEEFEVQAMIAVGKRGPKDALPESARGLEQPNGRRPLKEILFEGRFGAAAL